jgi:hypothetical protein
MIKFREHVPSVYISASRDFQYLSWLIDIVLNSVKHNVDALYDLPNTCADAKLSELLAMTLGFKVKRNYDQKQLVALVEVLPRILKRKGTLAAVNMAGKALIAASGATGSVISEVDGTELRVSIPKTLVDASLLIDLLPYILPAGMTCRVIRTDVTHDTFSTKVQHSDVVYAKHVKDLDWDAKDNKFTGLSTMFDGRIYYDNGAMPTFANFVNYNIDIPNVGLLDNSIIPDLMPTIDEESSNEK